MVRGTNGYIDKNIKSKTQTEPEDNTECKLQMVQKTTYHAFVI